MSDSDKKIKEEQVVEEKIVQEESQEKEADVKVEEKTEVEETQEGEKTQTVIVKGKKKKKKEPFLRGGRGQAHIKSSYNNTIVSITDLNGSVLVWATAGKCGFKGPKKATPYAAGVIVKSLIDKIKGLGIKEVDVYVRGVGTGREAAVRALGINGVQVVSIKDVTPMPHGGCRPKKPRRV